MLYDATCIAIDEAQAETQLSTTDQLFEKLMAAGPLEAAERSLAVSSR